MKILGTLRMIYKKSAKKLLCGIILLIMWYCGTKIVLLNLWLRGEQDESLYKTRVTKLRHECQKLQTSPGLSETHEGDTFNPGTFKYNVFVNRRHSLLYCSIAKIGCTFWKRVFKVLDESNTNKLYLYDMAEVNAHSNIPDSMMLKNTTQEEFKVMLATYMKFMFVRDPFSRLFSAYVDKILIPTTVLFKILRLFKEGNLTNEEKIPCGLKLTFGQFCSLLADAMLQKNTFDPHFTSISLQCQPCEFNFTFVGKMETFMTDFRELLRRANITITDVIGDVEEVETAHEVNSIKSVIHRVWVQYFSRSDNCLSQVEVAERLWKHLQIRGFISKHIPLFTSHGSNTQFSIENYTAVALKAYEQSEPRDVRMLQKKEAMKEAYSSVPRVTLEKISRLYAQDCLLFGYSCDPRRFVTYDGLPFYFRDI